MTIKSLSKLKSKKKSFRIWLPFYNWYLKTCRSFWD